MEEDLEYKIVSVEGDEQHNRIGSVFSTLGATYSKIRAAIREDEITNGVFQMLTGGGSVLSAKQEEKMNVKGDVVYIRFVNQNVCFGGKRSMSSVDSNMSADDQLGNGGDLPMTKFGKDQGIAAIDDCLLSPPSGMEAVGTREEVPLRATRLRSKIAKLEDVQRWQREIDNKRRKLKKLGRYDIFELETRDVGKKAMFHIWCEECNDKYHRSGSNKPAEACANYLRSHINSDGHIKAYEGRIGLNSSLTNQSIVSVEETLAENKVRVEKALDQIKQFVVDFPTSSFEIVEGTVGNYSRLGAIKIRCTLDSKWLNLFPKTGSLESNLREHVNGKAHNVVVRASIGAKQLHTSDPKPKGRPPKPPSGKDHAQRDLSSFLVHVSEPHHVGSSSNSCDDS